MFIQESHLGGLYATTIPTRHEPCETCGDCDYEIGEVHNRGELFALLKGTTYSKEHVNELADELFPVRPRG